MRSRGFIISADAFLAITLLAVLASIAFFYLSTVSFTAWDNIDLINAVRDEAIVLEKQQVFENAIKQQSADPLLSKLNSTPNAFCFEVSIFSEDNLDIPIIYVSKTGCTKNFSELVVANRTIVSNSDTSVGFYIAKVGGWYK